VIVYFWTLVDAPLRALPYPASSEMRMAVLLVFGNLLFVGLASCSMPDA
jgi:hypothetical protein